MAVKDEASKGQVVIDSLHEKLIILDNIARKQNHDLKDKINLILSRFHIHKNKPKVAADLVLKLVCTKEEEAVLDKEHKLLKAYGINENQYDNDNVYGGSFSQGFNQVGGPYRPYVMPPRFPMGRRPRPRMSSTTFLCFKCN